MKIPPPVAELVGFEVVSAGDGHCTMKLEAQQRHSNPMGTLHGGILCDLADGAMGCACVSLLAEGDSFATIELKINFLKPVWTGRLTAVGEVLKAGRTITLCDCRITDDGGSLVAYATSTCMTQRGEAALAR